VSVARFERAGADTGTTREMRLMRIAFYDIFWFHFDSIKMPVKVSTLTVAPEQRNWKPACHEIFYHRPSVVVDGTPLKHPFKMKKI